MEAVIKDRGRVPPKILSADLSLQNYKEDETQKKKKKKKKKEKEKKKEN